MKNPHAHEFSNRLKIALAHAGVKASASHLASEFNLRYWGQSVSNHAVRNWLIGISIPKQDKLVVLADWLRVSPEALLFGTEPVRPADQHFSTGPVNLVDQRVIAQYFKLSAEHRFVVRMIVEALRGMPKPALKITALESEQSLEPPCSDLDQPTPSSRQFSPSR